MLGRHKSLEESCLVAFDPPIAVFRPERLTSPFVFCSPHSGNIYPADFLSRSDQPLTRLRKNEDAFIDAFFAPVTDLGAPLLTARFPRCFVDVNRAEDELPQKWLPRGVKATVRAESGLGVIPTVLGENQSIYRRPLRQSVVPKRIQALYRPYHQALEDLIQEARSRFGHAILVDCHSMPGFALSGARRADIILGDRYGTSCHSETVTRVERLFSDLDYSVTRNYPYAGSYVTSHYGQPHDGVETIQIEINRDLYLNPVTIKPKAGYDKLAKDIHLIVGRLIAEGTNNVLQAAE